MAAARIFDEAVLDAIQSVAPGQGSRLDDGQPVFPTVRLEERPAGSVPRLRLDEIRLGVPLAHYGLNYIS